MLIDQAAALRHCIRQYRDTLPEIAAYADAVQQALEHGDLPALIAIYHAVYPLLEREIGRRPTADEGQPALLRTVQEVFNKRLVSSDCSYLKPADILFVIVDIVELIHVFRHQDGNAWRNLPA